MNNYGEELVMDLHDCKIKRHTRKNIKKYFIELCKLIDMKRGPLHFWDYKGAEKEYKVAPPHLKGISAVQFIYTSNITIHTLDDMKNLYVNIFSCKSFSMMAALNFTEKWFKAEVVNYKILIRS